MVLDCGFSKEGYSTAVLGMTDRFCKEVCGCELICM